MIDQTPISFEKALPLAAMDGARHWVTVESLSTFYSLAGKDIAEEIGKLTLDDFKRGIHMTADELLDLNKELPREHTIALEM